MSDTENKEAYSGELIQLNKVEAALGSLREKYGVVPDAGTKDGYALCKAGIKEVRGYRTTADKLRLSITEPHREFIKQVNDQGNGLIERLREIEEPLKAAKQHEDDRAEREKQERITRLQLRIDQEILSYLESAKGQDSNTLADMHTAVESLELRDYYDLTAEAENAKADVLRQLSSMHGQALERERLISEQAEVEAERRRLREEEESREAERQELEELRQFKADQEAKREAEEAQKRKPQPEPAPEPEPLPAAAESQPEYTGVDMASEPDKTVIAEHRAPIDTRRLEAAANSFQRGSQVKAPEQVTISRKEYDQLLAAEAKLLALEAAGVDNWSGYDDAMEQLEAA